MKYTDYGLMRIILIKQNNNCGRNMYSRRNCPVEAWVHTELLKAAGANIGSACPVTSYGGLNQFLSGIGDMWQVVLLLDQPGDGRVSIIYEEKNLHVFVFKCYI